jgi:hypothetical protein
MGNYRSSELREMREALRVFTDAYVAYLQNPSSQGRSQVLRAMPEAEMALSTGGGGMTFTDPVRLRDAAASGRGRGRCRRRLRRRPAARALVIEAAVARVVGVLLGPDTP